MSKKLVAYFSASGVTKAAAERLAKAAKADLFEIKPAVPYTQADLDWTNKKSRSSVEMNNPNSRPEIAEKVSNMGVFDTLLFCFLWGLVGVFVWWLFWGVCVGGCVVLCFVWVVFVLFGSVGQRVHHVFVPDFLK